MTPTDDSGTRALVTLGESMGLITADDIGPIEYARSFSFGIGGAESNVAIGVARLGGESRWIGRLGHDAVGDMIERRLQAETVRVLAIRDHAFTGLMVKHRRFGDALQVDYHRRGSAGSHLSPADLPPGTIETAAILHVTGITPALSESAAQTVSAAIGRAHAAGVTVSFDVNYRSKLWTPEDARPALRRLAESADLLFASVHEATLLLGNRKGSPASQLARTLTKLGPRQVVVKDAERGCAAFIDSETFEFPAVPVRVIDPVGAGDAFAAGYLADLLAGRPARDRLTTATAAGAFAVTVPGDCEGLPRRSDLEALLTYDDISR